MSGKDEGSKYWREHKDDKPQPVRPGTMSAFVRRLASRLGVDPYELAERFGDDTVRRTQYPVIERPSDDGRITYSHPVVRE